MLTSKIIIFLLILLFLFVIILIGAISYARKKVLRKLYNPTKTIIEWEAIEHLRDIYISTTSGQWSYDRPVFDGDNINVWYGNWYDHRPVVLYFHGNSLNISYREYMAKLCAMMKLNILLVDYRGYGRSQGTTTSHTVLKDATTAMAFILAHRREEDIIVWGESLGGSPACYIASKYPKIRKIILLSTFTSLHSLLRNAKSALTNLVYSVARWATYDIDMQTNNARMLSKCQSPILIVHSKEDNLIPYDNAVGLYNCVCNKDQVRILSIKGDHDSPIFNKRSIKRLLTFIDAEITNIDEILLFINNIRQMQQNSAGS